MAPHALHGRNPDSPDSLSRALPHTLSESSLVVHRALGSVGSPGSSPAVRGQVCRGFLSCETTELDFNFLKHYFL